MQSNFESSLKLFEDILANARADEEALLNLKLATIKERNDAKLNKQTILWSAMMNYAKYGENSAFRNKMSQEKLNNVTSSKLLDLIKNLSSYDHRITYYGPEKMNEVSNILNKYHTNNTNLKEIPGGVIYEELPLDVPLVFVVDYEMHAKKYCYLKRRRIKCFRCSKNKIP